MIYVYYFKPYIKLKQKYLKNIKIFEKFFFYFYIYDIWIIILEVRIPVIKTL